MSAGADLKDIYFGDYIDFLICDENRDDRTAAVRESPVFTIMMNLIVAFCH